MANGILTTTNTQPDTTTSGLLSQVSAETSTAQDGQYTSSLTPTYDTAQPDTVEQRLTNLLEKDNPYLAVAREGAKRTAASRGLLNTSIAAGSGESAAIESALPIAQQDAQYYQNLAQTQQQGDIESMLQQEQGGIESMLQQEQGEIQTGLYETQGDISSQLSAQEAEQTSTLSAQEAGQQGILSAQQAEQAAALSAQEAGQTGALSAQEAQQQGALSAQQAEQTAALSAQEYQQQEALNNAQLAFQQLELESNIQLEYEKLDKDTQETFNATVNEISEDYMSDYMEIMMSPDFDTDEDRQWAIDVLAENTKQRFEIAAQIAGTELSWDIANELVSEMEGVPETEQNVIEEDSEGNLVTTIDEQGNKAIIKTDTYDWSTPNGNSDIFSSEQASQTGMNAILNTYSPPYGGTILAKAWKRMSDNEKVAYEYWYNNFYSGEKKSVYEAMF